MKITSLGDTLILWKPAQSPEPTVLAKHMCFGQLHCIRGDHATAGIILGCFAYVCKLVSVRSYLKVYLRLWVITYNRCSLCKLLYPVKIPTLFCNVGSCCQWALARTQRGRCCSALAQLWLSAHSLFFHSFTLQNFQCKVDYQKCKWPDIVSIWNSFGTARISVWKLDTIHKQSMSWVRKVRSFNCRSLMVLVYKENNFKKILTNEG